LKNEYIVFNFNIIHKPKYFKLNYNPIRGIKKKINNHKII